MPLPQRCPHPKSGGFEYVTATVKMCDSEGMIKLRTLRWGDSLGGPNLITRVFERREPFPTVVREKDVNNGIRARERPHCWL